MNITSNSAAQLYINLIEHLTNNPMRLLCNNSYISHELLNINITLTPYYEDSNYITIFSYLKSRAFPITFALAELAWILTGNDNIETLQKFNKSIINYSKDGIVTGAYGNRFMLNNQIYKCIDKLNKDINTRQACIIICQSSDIDQKHIPCNIFIQFLIRNNKLNMFITSRSSDFITGFPIDLFHWQFVHILIKNSLIHKNINIGNIYYNIASLHVYEKDKCFIHYVNSEFSEHEYEHVINLTNYNYSYNWLQQKAMNNFDKCNSLVDLAELIFIFDFNIKKKLTTIKEIYKNQGLEYKPQR